MIIHFPSSESRPSVSVTETIVGSVSDAEGCDPLALPPLWDVIDPEALDGLFAPTRSGAERAGRVGFTYAGYGVDITVDRDGAVSVSLESLEATDA